MSTPSSSSSSPLSDRAQQAAKIINEPGLYKICEGCDSIVTEAVVTCPNCHSYRFNSDHQEIIDHALILGSRERTSVLADDLT